jgi:predicted Zn-dependent protease
MKILNYVFLLATIVVISSCSKEDKTDFDSVNHFYQNASELIIEVAYEEGATPYISSGGNNIWSFTEYNISALFEGRNRPILVSVPNQLAQMTEIPNQNKQSYNNDDIRKLAAEYKKMQSDETRGVIFLVFLDGYYFFNGSVQNNVVGVSVGKFAVAVFKPVIESIPSGLFGNSRPNVEQATVVHEIGHALGLVNNGVDMEEDHQDVQHGKHCTNEDCVMFWLNESAGDMSSFIGSGIFGNNQPKLVFGQECLNDTRNYLN